GRLELAIVICGALAERLSQPLHHPAVQLPVHDHRIDHRADVVDGPVTQDLDGAGIAIQLDFADMHAIREGEIRRIVERVLVEARLELAEWVVVRHVGRTRYGIETHAPVGASHAERAVAKLEIALGRLQQMSSDALALRDYLGPGRLQRRAADRDRARAERAGADGHGSGIAFDHADALERHAELASDDLRI